jgi:hypothetical protein
MWKTVQKNILEPSIRRVGTLVAPWLIAQGVHADLANQVAIGVVAFGLIASDFFLSWKNRQGAK